MIEFGNDPPRRCAIGRHHFAPGQRGCLRCNWQPGETTVAHGPEITVCPLCPPRALSLEIARVVYIVCAAHRAGGMGR